MQLYHARWEDETNIFDYIEGGPVIILSFSSREQKEAYKALVERLKQVNKEEHHVRETGQ